MSHPLIPNPRHAPEPSSRNRRPRHLIDVRELTKNARVLDQQAAAINSHAPLGEPGKIARERLRRHSKPSGEHGLVLAASLVLAAASGGLIAALYAFLGAFTYGIVYTVWLKRRTVWNIVVGGLAGSFAVLAGAAAVDPAAQAAPLIFAVVLFLWTPPHFWSLAAARRDDYAAAAVPMLPVTASDRTWTLAILLHTAALAILSLVPLHFGLGPIYGAAAVAGGGYFLWRSWQRFVAPSRAAAMSNFAASLIQLSLLLAGIIADGAVR